MREEDDEKRITSGLLALLVAFSTLPLSAAATEETLTPETEAAETVVEETTSAKIPTEEIIAEEGSVESVQLLASDSEPNDYESSAVRLYGGNSVSGTVGGLNYSNGVYTSQDPRDYYYFSLDSGTYVNISVSSGARVWLKTSFGGRGVSGTLSLAAGTYYIWVESISGSAVSYTLSLKYYISGSSSEDDSGSDSGSGGCSHSSYSYKVTYPNCSSGGYTTYTCKSCGYSWKGNYTDVQHEYYNTWSTETEPTCTEDGVEVRYCYNCGKRQTRSIAATGHSLGEWTVTKEPTCKETGIQTAVCSVCGESAVEDVPVTEHSFTELELTKAPSSTKEGTLSVVCSFCGEVESTQPLPMLEDGQTQYNVPDGVTRVGHNAFSYRTDLTSVIIPDGVTYIGQSAFRDCSKLASIIIPNGVTSINDWTFYGCKSLLSITIPDSVTRIGYSAFYGCNSLTSITIPDSITQIDSSAFAVCNSLEAVYITDLAAWCQLSFNNHTANPLWNADKLYVNGKLLTDCVIPEGVTRISNYAFYDYDYLTSVSIPSSIISIGTDAFASCNSLSRVTISFPKPPKTIPFPYNLFSGCTALNTVFFIGDVPTYSSYYPQCFRNVTATAYYPAENDTWTETVRNSIYGDLTWVACPHTFEGHSCTSNGVCTGCGAVKAASHDYVDATCTEPKTCNYCRITIGSALGHTEITMESKAPTCTEAGLTEGKTCQVCGEILIEQEEIPMIKHQYENGVCTNCGNKKNVIRISSGNRYGTAIAIAKELKATLKVEKFNTILIASGEGFPDALAGTYLATVTDAPILLTKKDGRDDTMAYVKENLAPGGKIYILGGKNTISESVETALKAITPNVTRLAGSGRYDTCLAILNEAAQYAAADEVLVCSANDKKNANIFADSLSASAMGRPILLIDGSGTGLTDGQKEYLAGKTFVIIGGENTVTLTMEKALSEVGTRETRLSGPNRVATSIKIAKYYFAEPSAMVLADGKNYPDGLCGGALASAKNIPLLLTAGGEDATADYVTAYDINAGFVVGGKNSVSDETARTIFNLAENVEILK